MTNQELQQLAREYVKSLTEDNKYAPFDTELLITLNFLRWLAKTHCIVSHKDVKEWVENASCFMPTSNLQKAMKFGAKKLFGEATFEEDSESARKSSTKTTDNI